MVNTARRKRRWLAWCRYLNHYRHRPHVVAPGRALVRVWNQSADRGWPWP